MQKTTLHLGPGAIADYYTWLQAARHGDMLIYYHGDLQYDRAQEFPTGTSKSEEGQRMRVCLLDALADRVSDDARTGVVTLTQRRIGPNVYEYRAHRVNLRQARSDQANEQSDAERLPA